ncbi:BC1872 family protein [Paenibacillus sp. 1P03SA]|uniref:BC1872 family protein n=1 Tax=Paenibacillus sp. 1P03SA TaxID=3132294 RepID=UPI0039A387AA
MKLSKERIIADWGKLSNVERDAWVASALTHTYPHCPRYTTDISAAWDVVTKMQEKGFSFLLNEATERSAGVVHGNASAGDYHCNFMKDPTAYRVYHPSATEAICLAALIAKYTEVSE